MASGTVFVVDDEPDSLTYVTEIVTGAGYPVEAVSDASEAVEKMKAAPPAMVFLDVQMPRMNGFQVLKAMREAAPLADVPVVLLSAMGAVTGEDYDPEKIHDQYGVRPDAFLSKPVDPEAVLGELNRFLAPGAEA